MSGIPFSLSWDTTSRHVASSNGNNNSSGRQTPPLPTSPPRSPRFRPVRLHARRPPPPSSPLPRYLASASPSRSWDDGEDQFIPKQRSDSMSVQSLSDALPAVTPVSWSSSYSSTDNRSVVSDLVISKTAPVIRRAPPTPGTASTSLVVAQDDDDDMSSLGGGGVEEHQQPRSLMRMALALRNGDSCPRSLTADEQMLWDTIQQVVNSKDKATSPPSGPSRPPSSTPPLSSSKALVLVTKRQTPPIPSAVSASGEATSGMEHLRLRTFSLETQLSKQQTIMSALENQLEEKSRALDNAKMLITSLEHVGTDMRQKLRTATEEARKNRSEADARLASLDNLAVQLRDLRNQQRSSREAWHQTGQRLENNMGIIRDAAVVWEATQDASAVSQLSTVLCDSMVAIREGMERTSLPLDDAMSTVSQRIAGEWSGVMRSVEETSDELERLQSELKVVKSQNVKFQEELTFVEQERDDRLQFLEQEVRNLENRCSTNMSVLARKERELAVLRDSLKVDDDDGGYISDDATDLEEDDVPTQALAPTIPHIDSGMYGPSQAEALATLLVHASGAPSEHAHTLEVKLEQANTEAERARKELAAERESLANAKLIISSLEKANKSMREDLKSRLEDSNTEIASLLQKSVGSEKDRAQLRIDVETLRRQKHEEKAKYENVIDRLRATSPPPAAVSSSWSGPSFERKDDVVVEMID